MYKCMPRRDLLSLCPQVGRLLLNICCATPAGVVAFVPSFAQLDMLMERWETTGLRASLEGKKRVREHGTGVKQSHSGKSIGLCCHSLIFSQCFHSVYFRFFVNHLAPRMWSRFLISMPAVLRQLELVARPELEVKQAPFCYALLEPSSLRESTLAMI